MSLWSASAFALTVLYECAEADRDLTPRTSLVFTNITAKLPAKADRLVVDVWCADESEESFSIALRGGKGASGRLGGEAILDWCPLLTFPPNGSRRITFPLDFVKKRLDVNALSNITIRVVDNGAPCHFGIERVFALEKGEKGPVIETPPLRHPRDAAEHAVDFAAFKSGCGTRGFVVGWATSMENVRPRGGFKWRKADGVGVRLARGEYESVQILVAPNGKDLKGVQVALEGDMKPVQSLKFEVQSGGGESTNLSTSQPFNFSTTFAATNVAASVVGYSETTHPPPYVVRPTKGWKMKRPPCGWYPDPILDFQKSCDISGDDVQSFWIRVKCPRDQKAGLYKGTLNVSSEGAESVRIPFSVRVNDFEVGRVAPLALSISVQPWGPCTNDWRNAWRERPMETCDFFADYFITFNRLYNGAPAWDMLKRLKEQGRLNAFNLGYVDGKYPGERGEADFRNRIVPGLLRRYEKAKELGIEKHAHVFCCDEIRSDEFSRLTRAADDLHAAMPGVQVLTTAKDKLLGVDGSPLPNIDIFCPPTCWWNPAQVERAHRKGRQVWWYFCNDPASPWANMTLEGPPCEIRSLMGAQTQKFKPDGFLYYATCNWNAKEPIKEGPFTKWEPRSYGAYHGDGQWTCCGGPDNMFLPTIRLENFRDGIEDLWYAKLLEEKLREVESSKLKVKSAEWVQRARELLAVPNDVVKSLREFSTDSDVIYRWRNEMADLIEGAK